MPDSALPLTEGRACGLFPEASVRLWGTRKTLRREHRKALRKSGFPVPGGRLLDALGWQPKEHRSRLCGMGFPIKDLSAAYLVGLTRDGNPSPKLYPGRP